MRWMKIADFPTTQQVIEDCTQPSCAVFTTLSDNQPSDELDKIDRLENPNTLLILIYFLVEYFSVSPVSTCFEKRAINPTTNINQLQNHSNLIEIDDLPSSQIDIEEHFTQEKCIDTTETYHLHDSSLFNTASTSSSSSLSLNYLSPLDKLGPKSKELKWKKRGFAHEAIKVLREQRTRADIWKNERQQNQEHEDSDSELDLLVIDEIVECGRYILVGENISGLCLVLEAGVRSHPANALKGRRIRLFPPYSCKIIDYRGAFVSFYYDTAYCWIEN